MVELNKRQSESWIPYKSCVIVSMINGSSLIVQFHQFTELFPVLCLIHFWCSCHQLNFVLQITWPHKEKQTMIKDKRLLQQAPLQIVFVNKIPKCCTCDLKY